MTRNIKHEFVGEIAWLITNEQLNASTGTFYLGVGQTVQSTEEANGESVIDFAGYKFLTHFRTNYSMRIRTPSCMFARGSWKLKNYQWDGKGCKVSVSYWTEVP